MSRGDVPTARLRLEAEVLKVRGSKKLDADAPGSVDCYQCCPIANLACDDYLKRAVGFYGTLDWYSNDGETGRVPTDEYADFLERLCRRGCGKFGVSNWCASGTCATTEEV